MENPIEVEIGLYTLSPPNIAHKWALKYHIGFTTLAHNSTLTYIALTSPALKLLKSPEPAI